MGTDTRKDIAIGHAANDLAAAGNVAMFAE